MKISEVRYYLNEKTKEELVDIVIKLYRSGSLNQELLHNEINPENETIIKDKYKRIIRTECMYLLNILSWKQYILFINCFKYIYEFISRIASTDE